MRVKRRRGGIAGAAMVGSSVVVVASSLIEALSSLVKAEGSGGASKREDVREASESSKSSEARVSSEDRGS